MVLRSTASNQIQLTSSYTYTPTYIPTISFPDLILPFSQHDSANIRRLHACQDQSMGNGQDHTIPQQNPYGMNLRKLLSVPGTAPGFIYMNLISSRLHIKHLDFQVCFLETRKDELLIYFSFYLQITYTTKQLYRNIDEDL